MARVAQVAGESSATPRGEGEEGAVKKRSSGAHLGESHDDAFSFGGSVPDFDMFPKHLRVGPWSPLTWAMLAVVALGVLATGSPAWESYKSAAVVGEPPAVVRLSQLVLTAYCIAVHVHVAKKASWWPYCSYTMVGYVLLTLRFALGALGLSTLADALRFPTLAMALITTVLWWLVIMPIMLVCMPGDGRSRRRFINFNFSFFLVNVHLLNSPLALYDHYSTFRPLVLWDLWLSILLGLLYLLFYLLVLDPAGMHFYIILSPRPWWGCLSYCMVLSVYVGVFHALG